MENIKPNSLGGKHAAPKTDGELFNPRITDWIIDHYSKIRAQKAFEESLTPDLHTLDIPTIPQGFSDDQENV